MPKKLLSEEEKNSRIFIGEEEYALKDLIFAYNRPAVLKNFYNSLVSTYQGLPTISPIHDDAWASEAAEWLREGRKVAELGCGDGTFAKRVLKSPNKIDTFFLVDFSEKVLKYAEKKLSDCTICKFKSTDLEKIDRMSEMKGLDRAISINTIGDTKAEIALNRVNNILKQGGLFRATLYAKEYLDEFWKEEKNRTYFSTDNIGFWFTPSTFYKGTYSSVGYVKTPSEEQIDFCRIQRNYEKGGWKHILNIAGFQVLESNLIKYPEDMVLQRWEGQLSQKQRQFIEEHNGYPECYDIIAKKENEGEE